MPQIHAVGYSNMGFTVLEKGNVSLMCQAFSNPPSQYVWFYNNSQIYTGPQLTITKIIRMQSGNYTCLAQNTYLNTLSEKTITLTVYCECYYTPLIYYSLCFLCFTAPLEYIIHYSCPESKYISGYTVCFSPIN